MSSRGDDAFLVKEKSLDDRSKEIQNDEANRLKTTRSFWFHSSRTYSIQGFVASAGIVMCAQMALTSYSKSVLTSIEKYFGISSSLAGFIVGSFNIGNLLLVVAVSKFSGTSHRPRIVAAGSLLIALGGFVNFTPHLATKPYQPFKNSTITATGEDTYQVAAANLYIVLILGEVLQGIGATVHVPLCSSYIDDFSSKNNSPVYLGILFVLQNIGPAVGYLVGAWSTTLYVDFDRVNKDETLTEKSNLWIGAWWLGYLILSAWVLLAAVPLFFFPKSMKRSTRDEATNEAQLSTNLLGSTSVDASGKKTLKGKIIDFCKDFCQTFKRLMTNLPFMLIVFGYTCFMFVVSALTSFMPKFLEVVFHKTPGSANLTFGIAIPPTVCIGLLSGGILVKKFGWERLSILKFVIFAGICAIIPTLSGMFVSCESANEQCRSFYWNQSNTTHPPNVDNLRGCKEFHCQLASTIFVLLTSVAALMAANMVTPIFTVLLKSVNPDDKCTAIGVLFFILRAFGMIPAPIICGKVIDGTCIEWNEEGGKRTSCLHYNQEEFRFRYLLIILLSLLLGIVFIAIAYFRILSSSQQKNTKLSSSSYFFNRLMKRKCQNAHEPTTDQTLA